MIRIIFILLTLFQSQAVFANLIKVQNINESYSETVKVSGSFFLGIQFFQKSKLDKLNILFPDNSKGMLCINLASIDGRYKASIRHELDTPVSGLNQLDFPSKYQSVLNNYKPNELAVRASIGKSCSNDNARILIASWSNVIDNSYVVLLIRSDARKDVVYVPSISKGFKCKKFKNEYKVTYDKYCELKGVDITEVESIKVKRKNLQNIPDELIELGYGIKK